MKVDIFTKSGTLIVGNHYTDKDGKGTWCYMGAYWVKIS